MDMWQHSPWKGGERTETWGFTINNEIGVESKGKILFTYNYINKQQT